YPRKTERLRPDPSRHDCDSAWYSSPELALSMPIGHTDCSVLWDTMLRVENRLSQRISMRLGVVSILLTLGAAACSPGGETPAQSTSARYDDLQSRGIATKEQADQARTAATALDATIQSDRAAVENAKVQLQYATITAPLSGRTGALIVHEGNLVRANDVTALVVINQVSPVYVSFGVPEGQLPDFKRYLAQGSLPMEAVPNRDSGAPSKGRVSFVDNSVDPTTGTIKIKGTFPNDDRRLW